MKQLATLLLFIATTTLLKAQTFGNEWINYDQTYFQFPVAQTGLYRITYTDLQNAGIPVGTFSSNQIQIFGRNHEVPLLMVDNGDNAFESGDYFLFEGKKNDGWLDSALYASPNTIGNPTYSLVSDTNYYYFTWTTVGNGLRFQLETDNNYAAYTPISFIQKTIRSPYNGTYFEGLKEGYASGSIYSEGEGYGYTEVYADQNNSSTLTSSFPTPYPFTGTSFTPKLKINSVSNSSSVSGTSFNHHLVITALGSNTVLHDEKWVGYQSRFLNLNFPLADIIGGNMSFTFSAIADIQAEADRIGLVYFEFTYPRQPIASGGSTEEFQVLFNPNAAKSRLDLTGIGGSGLAVYYNNGWKIQRPTISGGTYQYLFANQSNASNTAVTIWDENSPLTISNLKPVAGTGTFVDYSLNNLDSALIFVYHKSMESGTQNYVDYRKSPTGGSYNALTFEIEQLYHQFGGGIRQHPMAIRNLVDFVYSNSSQHPAGLVLIGKGITHPHQRPYSGELVGSFVPSSGYPSSDIAFSNRMHGTNYEPLVPTGRLSVRNNTQLQEYLDKVIEYEAAQHPLAGDFEETLDWQKQILHFVGGSDLSQQTNFQNWMNGMKAIIEDTAYAGNVTSFFKTSSDPLDPTVVSGVTDLIESGVSLMNFFGHAAASNNGFEINIDEPSNWDNEGKYPVVIGNSCYNGNIFDEGVSTSEKFVNIPNEGAIAFLSSVYVGYDTELRDYSTEFYRQFSLTNYGQNIGSIMKQTIRNLQQTTVGPMRESTLMQMALNGDPMLTINHQAKPELSINASSVLLLPNSINLQTDSIELVINLKNLGRGIGNSYPSGGQMVHTDSIQIEIIRDFPGASADSVYNFYVYDVNYETVIQKKFPLQPEYSAGLNTFTVNVDIPNSEDEQYEEISNNRTSVSFFIPLDGINPVWPYNFAVVPYDTVTVKASTINPIAEIKTYRFQIDTTDTYDSPQLREFTVTGTGGVKEVRFDQWLTTSGSPSPLICADSTVYFWRVAVDSSTLFWSEFSFQYIKGKRGWGQDHFFQFKNNAFNGITYNRTDRLLEFPASQVNFVNMEVYDNYSVYNQWALNYGIQDYATCAYLPAIYVGVLDPITFEAWKTHCPTGSTPNNDPSMDFGNYNNNCGCRNRYEKYFVFDQTQASQLQALENMLTVGIPDSFYVSVYAPVAAYYSYWDSLYPNLFNTFQSFGATQITSSRADSPFALFFKKGTTTQTVQKVWPEDIDPSNPTRILLQANINRSNIIGFETTPKIGPAFEWQTVYWRRDSIETPSGDSVRLKIRGYDWNGSITQTVDTLFTPNDSILNLSAFVNAQLSPYIDLSLTILDKDYFTPAQIDRLHVLYSPVPEAAIDGSNGYYFIPTTDSIKEGQDMAFAVDVKNISDYPMDSLLINYWVQSPSNTIYPIPYVRQKPLLPGEVLRDTVPFSSLYLSGTNNFWMEVNPYINGSLVKTDQPEQYHFNNLLQIPFIVDPDDEHPILDVTFNGQHILNGDIIDPESEIVITLKDENPFLVMDNVSDTTLFGIYITDPGGNLTRIPFIDANGNQVMQWIPAEAQQKKFKIVYPSNFLKNGKYSLLVQGSDRSGNLSGDMEYRVNFEIVRESTITQMLNYPNPFSTSTRFVFTLTGTEEPDDILIQIMTVTGRVVKEIDEKELGKIHIGRNITEYAWDGTDNFGDPLANGVYLYRVKAKINGEDIKQRESGADQYFEKEFGKMYLFR